MEEDLQMAGVTLEQVRLDMRPQAEQSVRRTWSWKPSPSRWTESK